MSHRLIYEGDWSFAVRKDFILNPKFSVGAKALFIALKSYCSPNSPTSFPSTFTLSSALSVSRETVRKYMGELEKGGLLTVKQDRAPENSEDAKPGTWARNVYTIREKSCPCQLYPQRTKSVTDKVGTNRGVQEDNEDHKNNRVGARFVFPPALDTPEFKAAWADWDQHRREIRHPLTPTSTKRNLSELSEYGPEGAVRAIHHTISKGWWGLVIPPDVRKVAGNGNGHVAKMSTTSLALNGDRDHPPARSAFSSDDDYQFALKSWQRRYGVEPKPKRTRW